MDKYYIYNGKGKLVVHGYDKQKCIEVARSQDDGKLVGEGVRPDGSTYGFYISVAPIALG